MSQTAKQWLAYKVSAASAASDNSGRIKYLNRNGGIVGSLIGLGYVEKIDNRAFITRKGRNWIKNQQR